MSITAKTKLTNEKKIILALGILLILSCGFLFFIERGKMKGTNTASWELYFANPKSAELTFVIKNNGKKANFSWKVLTENGKIIRDGEENIATGKKTIILEEENREKETIIEVTSADGNRKEIYKR